MEEKKFNLNDHVHRLLIQEPFFASLSRTIEKIESKGVPTAGFVSIQTQDTLSFTTIHSSLRRSTISSEVEYWFTNSIT